MDPSSNSRKRRAQRRTGCSRNRKYYGGGLGTSYGFGGSVDPANPSLGNAAEVVKFSSCGNAVPTGFLTDAGTKGGLPGFAGGGRRRKNRRNTRRRKTMYGGTYTFVPNVVGDSKIAVPESSYQGCGEGRFAQPNMLVQQPPPPGYPTSFLTAPAPLVPAPAPGSPFVLQKGGAPVSGNSYAVDAMLYSVPRSGYSDLVPSGPTAAGPPFSIHTPYSAQPQPSPACLKTGGGSRKKKARKGSRKNRSSSRKNRKNRNTRKTNRK